MNNRLGVVFLLTSVLASMPVAAADPVAITYGHVHLAAPDPALATQWYNTHFGGTRTGFAGATGAVVEIDRVNYNGIPIIFFKRDPGPGSVGSGVDHIGFSMADVGEKMQALVADGAKSLGETRSFRDMTIGFVEDPWGTKIELIDDQALRGLHHVHLSTPDPTATLAWYAKNLGGEKAQFAGALAGINYDGKLWLLASKVRAEVAPTQGRSLDHLGWNFTNLDQGAATLKAGNIKFTMDPRDYRGIRIGFIEGPDGVRIELVQP